MAFNIIFVCFLKLRNTITDKCDIQGRSKRSRKRGIFPSYKITTLTKYHAFSKYPDDLASEDDALRIKNMPDAEEVYEYDD